MKLFISYARVDKAYCMEILDLLNDHDVWFDSRLHVGKNWWHEILKRLEWCEGFIYLLSPDSLQSSYCQREYEMAKSMGRIIFPILIRETTLPTHLAEVQYIDITKGISLETLKSLLASIHRAELDKSPQRPFGGVLDEASNSLNAFEAFTGGITALQKGLFDDAVFLLKVAKASGYKSPFIKIDAVLEEAELYLHAQMEQLERERNYKQIVELIQTPVTEKFGWEAFEAFHARYPDYDPNNLAYKAIDDTKPSRKTVMKFTLPLLTWCDVPEGDTQIFDSPEKVNPRVVRVPKFAMSQYTVTNAQFQAFIDDPKGYHYQAWWEFNPFAWQAQMKNLSPKPNKYDGADRPRTMVTWYEAMAFCLWLSDKLGQKITLFTYPQWVRAFIGDTQCKYPWGDVFDKNKCNTKVSDIKMPNVVTRYGQGKSPFGIYDMIGNVWEWSLDVGESRTHIGEQKQQVRGGSFNSLPERAEPHFAYELDPNIFHTTIGFRLVRLD